MISLWFSQVIELVLLRLERGRVVVAQHVARMAAAAAVAGELHHGEPGRLGAAGGQHLALVPLEAPERRADAVAARIDR